MKPSKSFRHEKSSESLMNRMFLKLQGQKQSTKRYKYGIIVWAIESQRESCLMLLSRIAPYDWRRSVTDKDLSFKRNSIDFRLSEMNLTTLCSW